MGASRMVKVKQKGMSPFLQGKASLALEHSQQTELQAADHLPDWGTQAEASTSGYRFVSERDRQDIQTQRQAIWDLLKSLGSHLLKDGVRPLT